MKKFLTMSVCVLIAQLLVGCKVQLNSITAPSQAYTGSAMVIEFKGSGVQGAPDPSYPGFIIEIPEGTAVADTQYTTGDQKGRLTRSDSITKGYIAENGYYLAGFTADKLFYDSGMPDGDTGVKVDILLSISSSMKPGSYTVKCALGAKNQKGSWIPQEPASGSTAVRNFSGISGKYESSPISIKQRAEYSLTVSTVGSGSGKVTSNVTIIAGAGATTQPLVCDKLPACSQSYPEDSHIFLMATPDPGSVFTGWSGAGCTGTEPCAIAMNSDQSVSAAFEQGHPVYRFYKSKPAGYYLTQYPNEAASILQNLPGYVYEGVAFDAASQQWPGASPVYKFLDSGTGERYYTIYDQEKDWISQNMPYFNYEGVAFYAYQTRVDGTKPVYKFLDPGTGGRYYTIYDQEKDWISQNMPYFKYEGVAFYAIPCVSQCSPSDIDIPFQDISLTPETSGVINLYDPSSHYVGGRIEVWKNTVDTPVTLRVLDKASDSPEKYVLNRYFLLGPDNYTFRKPISVTLPYSADDLTDSGLVTNRNLSVEYFDSGENQWIPIPSTNDFLENLLTFNVDRTGLFRISGHNTYTFSPDPFDAGTLHDQASTCPLCIFFGNLTYHDEDDFPYYSMTTIPDVHPMISLVFQPASPGDFGWGSARRLNSANTSRLMLDTDLSVDYGSSRSPYSGAWIWAYRYDDAKCKGNALNVSFQDFDDTYCSKFYSLPGDWANGREAHLTLTKDIKWADDKPYLEEGSKYLLSDSEGHIKVLLNKSYAKEVRFYSMKAMLDTCVDDTQHAITRFDAVTDPENSGKVYLTYAFTTYKTTYSKYSVQIFYRKTQSDSFEKFYSWTGAYPDRNFSRDFDAFNAIPNYTGVVELKLVITDECGNKAEKTTTATVDTVPDVSPPIVNIESPASNGNIYSRAASSDTIVVSGNVTDDKALKGDITLYNVNTKTAYKKSITGTPKEQPFAFNVQLAEGKNIIRVEATDTSDKKGLGAIGVILNDLRNDDLTGPQIVPGGGNSRSVAGDTAFVTVSVDERNTGNHGVDKVYASDPSGNEILPEKTICFDETGVAVDPCPESPSHLEARFRLQNLGDGVNHFVVQATDGLGNGNYQDLWITHGSSVRNTPPFITGFASVDPKVGVDNTITLKLFDSEGDRVYVNSPTVRFLGSGAPTWRVGEGAYDGDTYSFTFNTDKPGTYKFSFVIHDGDMMNEDSYTLSVTGGPDNDHDGYPQETDCDDSNPALNPETRWYRDSDNDGWSDGTIIVSCTRPYGYKLASELSGTDGDCGDSSPTVYPGAPEICGNGIDEDCDGSDLSCNYVDNDGDGYSEIQGDCNDADPSIHPGAVDICENGIDEDCDGHDLSCSDVDNDGDGYTENQGDCNDANPSVHPGATEICGNHIDENCDGYDLACACTYKYSGWSSCQNGKQTRTVIGTSPAGCAGTPVISRSCTTSCTYTYSSWGACQNGKQTRTVISASPAGCTGTPVLTQACAEPTPGPTPNPTPTPGITYDEAFIQCFVGFDPYNDYGRIDLLLDGQVIDGHDNELDFDKRGSINDTNYSIRLINYLDKPATVSLSCSTAFIQSDPWYSIDKDTAQKIELGPKEKKTFTPAWPDL